MSWNIKTPGDYINGPLTVVGVAQFNSNVGIGVAPSAWKTNHTAFQFGPYSTGYGAIYGDDSGNSWFASLYYQGASNRIYTATGKAAAYRLTQTGQHQWYTDNVGGNVGGTAALTQSMLLDAAGQLGLGVNPSVWSQGKALELGSLGNSVWGAAPNQTIITANSYFNGGWKYAANGTATNYEQASGQHFWYSAPNNTLGVGQTCTFGAAKMALDASGNLAPLGNLVVASGKGIDFSAGSNAAGMTSEILNDYEEGTFTPTIEGTSTAGTATYTTQIGRYTKVGRLVSISIRVTYSAGNGTGNLRVAGLPFATGSGLVWTIYAENIAMTAGNSAAGSSGSGVSTISLDQLPAGGGAAASIPYDGAGDIQISGTYTV